MAKCNVSVDMTTQWGRWNNSQAIILLCCSVHHQDKNFFLMVEMFIIYDALVRCDFDTLSACLL